MSSACDTLFSQSMGGRNKKRTGIWLQKSLLILNAFAVCLWALHSNIEPIFLLLGQIPEVAKKAAEVSFFGAPGIIFYANFIILLRFLQNKNIIYVPMLMAFVACVFNAVCQFLFLYVFGYGYKVVSIIQTTSYGIMMALELIYFIVGKKYANAWDGYKREAMTAWGEFAYLAICGACHYAFESVALHMGLLLAGTLDETLLGAQSILVQVNLLLFTVAFSLSVSLNIRVGQMLGQLNPEGAKLVFKTGLIIAIILGAVITVLIGPFSFIIPQIFTSHEDVIQTASTAFPILLLVFAIDCLRSCTDGTLRGSGQQKVGAIVIVIVFSAIGLPLSITLLFYTSLKIIGFWTGVCTAAFISFCFSLIYLRMMNWQREAVRAQGRVMLAHKAQAQAQKTSNEKTPLLPDPITPRRLPREPRSCSTNFENMSVHANIDNAEFRRLCVIRGLTFFGCLLLLATGIITSFTVPRELYRPAAGNETLI